MKIKYKNYTIYPCVYAPGRYDLFETGIATKKETEEKYEKEDDIAFGITIEGAMTRIMHLEVAKKNDTLDLAGFLAAYRAEKAEIEKQLSL